MLTAGAVPQARHKSPPTIDRLNMPTSDGFDIKISGIPAEMVRRLERFIVLLYSQYGLRREQFFVTNILLRYHILSISTMKRASVLISFAIDGRRSVD